MHNHLAPTTTGYDWSRFGRHRLRTPAGVLIDSPVGVRAGSWLGTLWGSDAEPCGWARTLWQTDATRGWLIPIGLAGGDVLEFGTHTASGVMRWYGIVDSYDAVEWLTVQAPYPDPAAAHDHAQRQLNQLRFAPSRHTSGSHRRCTRHRYDCT